ncbi:MAG TPA: hypothetical protein VNG12_17650 [Acidimicrobiales bacterium]|nr:hypothetical protein [Acidimicrobiales bacterium]
MDVAEVLKRSRALLLEKRMALDLMVQEVDELVQEVQVLEAVNQRWAEGEAAGDRAPWSVLGRSDAVHRVLLEAPEGRATNAQILQRLQEVGRTDDTSNYVAAALAHLRDKGLVRQTGRGAWVLRSDDDEDPDEEEATAPASAGYGFDEEPF